MIISPQPSAFNQAQPLLCNTWPSISSLQPSKDVVVQHVAFNAEPSIKQRTSKDLAIQVALSVSVWKQRLIVTAAPLAPELTQAFLTADASAVICRDPGSASQSSGVEVADCFKKMYEGLFSRGATVPAAVELAGKSHFLSEMNGHMLMQCFDANVAECVYLHNVSAPPPCMCCVCIEVAFAIAIWWQNCHTGPVVRLVRTF